MSQIDEELPAGEEIHMPDPSILPLLLTIGITMTLLGITVSPILLISGGILTVVVIARWIIDARHEYQHLPASHDH